MGNKWNNSKIAALSVLIAAIFSCHWSSVGAYAPEMKCKDFVAMMTKAQMTGIKDCSKEMKLSSKEKASKMNCIIRCIMIKEGLLDSNGQYSAEVYERISQERMPVNLVEKGLPLLRACGEESVGVLDSSDPLCKSYGTLVSCLLGAVGKLCKEVP